MGLQKLYYMTFRFLLECILLFIFNCRMPILVSPFVSHPAAVTIRLFAVVAYFAAFYNLNSQSLNEVEVANVVNEGYNAFSNDLYQYEVSLLQDPENQPGPEETWWDWAYVTLPSGSRVIGRGYSKTRIFNNIRYAEAPVGYLRFEDPIPYKQPAVIDATNYDWIACPQLGNDASTEDCLVLNVQVPSDYEYDPQNLLPVMIWVHGGSFAYGSNTDDFYTFSNTTGTIMVTMNYRLGYLGFLTYDEAGISGNQGLKDQRMAMKWVHENIEAFGGDKNKITIFGQSAGAQALEFHLVSEESRPYFNRAIVQSTYNVPYATREDANMITDIMIAQFQLRYKCSFLQSGIECLKNVPYQDLLEMNDYSYNPTLAFFGARSYFAPDAPWETNVASLWEGARPSVDGVDIKDQPSALFKSGQWSTEKDVVIGTCSGEYTIIELLPYEVEKEQAVTWAIGSFGESVGATVMDSYESLYPNLTSAQQLGNAMTEQWFSCYARSIARDMDSTGSGDVYLYEFSQPTNAVDLITKEPIAPQGKAVHSGEMEYLFGIPYSGMTGYQYQGDEKFISETMMEMWGNFAWEGMPNPSNLTNGWSKYTPDPDGNWPSLNIAAKDFAIRNNILNDMCNFWEDKGFWAWVEGC